MKRSPKTTKRLVDEYLAIEAEDAKEAGALAFMPLNMIMATIPHRKSDDHVYQRTNGDFTLTMMADPQFGVPYGSIPRLLVAWMTREAKLKRSPILYLGKTFSSFLRVLKLSQSGGKRGDAGYLREQMLRLFTTHISCVYQNKKEGVYKGEQFSVTKSFQLWWDPIKITGNNFLFSSTITLSEDFYKEIIERAIPVDFRVLRAFRRSPLQIDIYTWLTYRLPNLKRQTFISWPVVQTQFGSNYANDAMGSRDFKKHFLRALRNVQAFYEKARVEIPDDGLMLYRSPPHVKQKIISRGSLYV